MLKKSAATFSIILSYAAFLVTIYFYFHGKPGGAVRDPSFWFWEIIAGLILLLPIPAYLRTYVLNLPLEEYGVIYRNHLTESEMLALTAYKIFEVCNHFEGKTSWLKNDILLTKADNNRYFIDRQPGAAAGCLGSTTLRSYLPIQPHPV